MKEASQYFNRRTRNDCGLNHSQHMTKTYINRQFKINSQITQNSYVVIKPKLQQKRRLPIDTVFGAALKMLNYADAELSTTEGPISERLSKDAVKRFNMDIEEGNFQDYFKIVSLYLHAILILQMACELP